MTGWLEPRDPERFADRALEVLEGRAPFQTSAIVERAAEFGWDAFAARVDDVMEAVAHG